MIRVLIVDDSSFVRDILKDVLGRYSDIEVVGEARDGQEAQSMLETCNPNVVTMDLLMPMVSGEEASETIMSNHPTPIVLVADSESPAALYRTALEVGAVGAFVKPHGGFDQETSDALALAVRQAAMVRPPRAPTEAPERESRGLSLSSIQALGIVSSTGGPQTLSRFLGKIPKSLRIPICLVQHTTSGFSDALVSWLDHECDLRVELATSKSVLRPGVVTVAPDDRHLEVREGGVIRLSSAPPLHSLRPSGDLLLTSLAKAYGKKSAALVCTGMGHDGSDGLEEVRAAGGLCLVQDPSTAVMNSMPVSAHKRVPSSKRVKLSKLAEYIKRDLA